MLGKNFESIKVFDFNGKKIKEINDSKDNTIFIDSYYDNKVSENFIITGNIGHAKSYDYTNNKIYHTYIDIKDKDKENRDHDSLIINDKEDIIKLIDSCEDGNIRIWDFHKGLLLKKIKIKKCDLHGICLWNKDYLFVATNNEQKIILIDLKTGIIIKYLIGHNKRVLTIKKIIHPKYGECLISQNHKDSEIKLWFNGK